MENLKEERHSQLKTPSDQLLIRQKPNPFDFVKALDKKYLIVTFILGYLFIKCVLFSGMGFGVSLFTLAFIGSVFIYYHYSGYSVSKKSLIWWLAIGLVGMSFSLYRHEMFRGWKMLFLILGTAYAVTFSNDRLIQSKTSNWLIVDGLNSLLCIPFSNFDAWLGVLFHKSKEKREASASAKRIQNSNVLTIGLGILIGIFLLLFIMPLLSAADSGGFSKILDYFSALSFDFSWSIADQVVTILFALPVMMYFYGLIVGGLKIKSRSALTEKQTLKTLKSMKVLNHQTIVTILYMICGVYLIFIITQVPYYISAFKGIIPEGYASYSNYARNGFFELIRISIINLLLIIGVKGFSKSKVGDFKSIIGGEIALIVMTCFFIITALSKMFMYINAYGMTDKRLLPCLLMFLLLEIFMALIVRFKKVFSVTRLAVLTSLVIVVFLSFVNTDRLIVQYNADRYLDHSLNTFDVTLLYRADIAGLPTAIELYEKTDSEALQYDLMNYIGNMDRDLSHYQYKAWYERYYEEKQMQEVIQSFYELN